MADDVSELHNFSAGANYLVLLSARANQLVLCVQGPVNGYNVKY